MCLPASSECGRVSALGAKDSIHYTLGPHGCYNVRMYEGLGGWFQETLEVATFELHLSAHSFPFMPSNRSQIKQMCATQPSAWEVTLFETTLIGFREGSGIQH